MGIDSTHRIVSVTPACEEFALSLLFTEKNHRLFFMKQQSCRNKLYFEREET